MMNSKLLRNLPGVDEVLGALKEKGVAPSSGVKRLVRLTIAELRQELISGEQNNWNSPEILQEVLERCQEQLQPRLKKVINATGIILHTNLGRAPLAPAALDNIRWTGSGYCNLEYDLRRGERGSRQDICGFLLTLLTGADKAIIVNNNAAAVLLILDTLAQGGEGIISRGELVEIGGSFRIPEVMTKSGVRLREVGTTNRTRLSDYEEAINENTSILMKVHRSNFRISGFTSEVEVEELAALGRKYELISFYDLGSGSLFPHGDEPGLEEVVSRGMDIVSCSGDKLLGGSQAGIILGRRELLEKMEANNLMRALRVDRLSLAALESTLRYYLQGQPEEIPACRMLQAGEEELERRTAGLREALLSLMPPDLEINVGRGFSYSGGGTLPQEAIAGPVLQFKADNSELTRLHRRLREATTPIIASLFKNKLEINLRTVAPEEEITIKNALEEFCREVNRDE